MRDAMKPRTTTRSTRSSRWQSALLRAALLLLLVPLLLPSPSVAQTVSFVPAGSFTEGNTPRSVAIGDLNGDGKLDLAVANQTSASVSVLLGSTITPGTFVAATSFAVGVGPLSVAIGDL